jgi:diguanylate cyclase (GGDEF)-like protein/PAS domain S-box-containing protein
MDDKLDIEARCEIFDALLRERPGATVGAMSIHGVPLPWPSTIPLPDEHVVQDRSVFEMTTGPDHSAILGAFNASFLYGVGKATVRLADQSGDWVDVSYVDMRERHGIVARLVAPGQAPADTGERVPPRPTSPRFGIVHQDAMGVILDCDDSYASLWGGSREELIGRAGLDLVHPDDKNVGIEAWIAMSSTGNSQRVRFRGIRKDGSLSWREVTLHNRLAEPEHEVVAEIIDVSDEVAAHDALRAHELRLNRMAQAVPVGLFEIDPDRLVIYTNDRLHQILGTDRTDVLAELLATVVPEDRPRIDAAFTSSLVGREDVDVDVEVRLPATEDSRRCQMSVRAALDALERVVGAVICVSDVTEPARQRVKLERDLIQHAFHDPLTGLANRTLLINRMEDAVARGTASGDPVAVVLADLDGFKAINDSLGHSVGDELLRRVSDRIRTLLHAGDTAARVGGDEFIVLMEGFLDPERPRHTAEQILAALKQPFDIEGRMLQIDASIGIATSATAPGTEELMRDADLAMYRAKSGGRGRYEIFAPEMHEAALARVELETSLRRGLEEGQLTVFYQPIHGLRSGRVTSVEALVRWRHPTRGLVSPADFIPLAEETGLIVPIGRWVLDHSCAEAAFWSELVGPAAPKISINLSALQLAQATIVDDVVRALSSSGLDPARLVLEVTESVLVDTTGTEGHVAVLDQLHELGVELAIDDFGTGYSSLAYLQNLPFDVLKIDRAFVSRLGETDRNSALIDGILGLSRALDLRAVAEGIENVAQLRALEALGCDDGQGYLFSRPVDRASIRDYLLHNADKARWAATTGPRPPVVLSTSRHTTTTAPVGS